MLDKTIRDRICFYCGRPAAVRWRSGFFTCSHEVCKSLAWAHEGGRGHRPALPPPTAEQLLGWAIRRAEKTIRKAEDLDREFDERHHRLVRRAA